MPGLAADDPFLLRKGSGGATGAPADYHPGSDELASDGGTGTGAEGVVDEHGPSPAEDTDNPGTEASPQPEATVTPDSPETGGDGGNSSPGDNGGMCRIHQLNAFWSTTPIPARLTILCWGCKATIQAPACLPKM